MRQEQLLQRVLDVHLPEGLEPADPNVLDCFELERDGEASIFNPERLNNRKLLWHGSRFSNFVGILSQGMRIAPPEAPASGYNFGKGVYFADLVGKSTPYCRPELSD